MPYITLYSLVFILHIRKHFKRIEGTTLKLNKIQKGFKKAYKAKLYQEVVKYNSKLSRDKLGK